MPRPQRCRRICFLPKNDTFNPQIVKTDEPVTLTLDEYEVIRLVDLEEKTHKQCAEQMDISRSTVQEIYESARRKLAACIVFGRKIVISGGNCRICGGSEYKSCGMCCNRIFDKNMYEHIQKGDYIMKIAVTYENGQIFQHFGHTEKFKIYEIADNKIINTEIVDTNGSGHGALAAFLMQNNVNILICGGIGGGAQAALSDVGIKLYGGVNGNADDAVTALLNGTLGYNPNVRCSHHDHEHGKSNHSCGEHGCGSHGCGEHNCH